MWHLLAEVLPGKPGLPCLIEMGALCDSVERPNMLMFCRVFRQIEDKCGKKKALVTNSTEYEIEINF